MLAATLFATLVSLAAPLSALADTATPEQPQSPNAGAMNDVYFAILGVTITVFVLVGGSLLYSAIRFRARPGDPIDPPQIHGSTRLEIGWTIVPVLILVGLAGYTLAKMPDVQDAPSGARQVKVVGFQFGWEFTGVGGFKLPKNAPVNTPGDPGRHAGQAAADLPRRDPRLVGARAGAEGRPVAGHDDRHLDQRRQDRHL